MVVGAVQGIQGQERGQESARAHARHRIRAICSHSLFPTTTSPPLVQTKPEKLLSKSKGKKRGKKGEEAWERGERIKWVFPHFPFKKLKSFSDSIPASSHKWAGQKFKKSSKKARDVASQRKIFLGRDKGRKVIAPWGLFFIRISSPLPAEA